jgi:hypothetical protein
MIIHNKTIYKHADLGGLFEGYIPSGETIDESLPTMTWKGGKIPFAMWQQMSAFFRHTFETKRSESQLRLFYHESMQQWRTGPLPQRFPSGMTTKELSDHPLYESTKAVLMEGGYAQWGTAHHHCEAGAFQSGTDTKDEETTMGLHLTLGDMGKNMHSFHARVVVIVPGTLGPDGKVAKPATSVQYAADILDWFEMPEPLPGWLPLDIQRGALMHALCLPSEAPFPDEWKTMLIDPPPVVATPHRFGQGARDSWLNAPQSYKPHSRHDDDFRWWDEDKEIVTTPASKEPLLDYDEPEPELTEAVIALAEKHGLTYYQMRGILEYWDDESARTPEEEAFAAEAFAFCEQNDYSWNDMAWAVE